MSKMTSQLRREINGNLSEKDFLSQIIDLLKLFHWKFEHTFEQRIYAKRTSKGFPDLVIVRAGELLFAEVKSEKGKVSLEQQEWIDALQKAGCLVEIWRPSDWDRILEMLK